MKHFVATFATFFVLFVVISAPVQADETVTQTNCTTNAYGSTDCTTTTTKKTEDTKVYRKDGSEVKVHKPVPASSEFVPALITLSLLAIGVSFATLRRK